MPLRTKFQCIASEGKCLVEVRHRSEPLETGMEKTREIAQCRDSMRMPLGAKLQCIAFEGKCLLEVRKRSDLLGTGVGVISEVP